MKKDRDKNNKCILIGTITGLRHSITIRDLLQNLLITHGGIRRPSISNNLTKHNTKRPHIGFNRELVINSGFRSGPLDRKLGSLSSRIDILRHVLDESSEPEIGDFGLVVFSDKDITSG